MNKNEALVGAILLIVGLTLYNILSKPLFKYNVGQKFCVQNIGMNGLPNQFNARVVYEFELGKRKLYVVQPDLEEIVPPQYMGLIEDQDIDHWLDVCQPK